MKSIILCILCGLALAGAGCRRQHIKTVAIHVPEMKSDACAALVRRAVQGVAGVLADDIRTDVREQMVTVRYDSLQLARKNIQFAIAGAGFRVVEELELERGIVTNTIPANAQALERLPPSCRP